MSKADENGGDFASGDAFDIHFGQGELESAYTAHALFQGGLSWPRRVATVLGLKPVGVGQTGFGSLVRSGVVRQHGGVEVDNC